MESEELDPRIQDELETLNIATDNINRLEKELEDSNAVFRNLLSESTHQLNQLAKKLGSCVRKARPYYEAVKVARKAHVDCQEAAIQYQKANSVHQAAKETVSLAEQRFLSKKSEWEFDNTWQELLNQMTMKVIEAENQKAAGEHEHQRKADVFRTAEQQVHSLELRLSKEISKSRPYFEAKDLLDERLAAQKRHVESLQEAIGSCKRTYARTLGQLESISEEIHGRRRAMQPREPGVGAEQEDGQGRGDHCCEGAQGGCEEVRERREFVKTSEWSKEESQAMHEDERSSALKESTVDKEGQLQEFTVGCKN